MGNGCLTTSGAKLVVEAKIQQIVAYDFDFNHSLSPPTKWKANPKMLECPSKQVIQMCARSFSLWVQLILQTLS